MQNIDFPISKNLVFAHSNFPSLPSAFSAVKLRLGEAHPGELLDVPGELQ
jgi:hypothetical protein